MDKQVDRVARIGIALLLAAHASGQILGSTWIKSSGDGSRAIIVSDQALLPADQNNTRDVYLYDYSTGQASLVSVNAQGTSGNGESNLPYSSADGETVVFLSYATDLAPTSSQPTVYARDLRAGTTTSLWSSSTAVPLAITPDARFVVITVPGSAGPRLLVLDRASGGIDEVDVNNAGQQMEPSYPTTWPRSPRTAGTSRSTAPRPTSIRSIPMDTRAPTFATASRA
jgi:hypothetical protein